MPFADCLKFLYFNRDIGYIFADNFRNSVNECLGRQKNKELDNRGYFFGILNPLSAGDLSFSILSFDRSIALFQKTIATPYSRAHFFSGNGWRNPSLDNKELSCL